MLSFHSNPHTDLVEILRSTKIQVEFFTKGRNSRKNLTLSRNGITITAEKKPLFKKYFLVCKYLISSINYRFGNFPSNRKIDDSCANFSSSTLGNVTKRTTSFLSFGDGST